MQALCHRVPSSALIGVECRPFIFQLLQLGSKSCLDIACAPRWQGVPGRCQRPLQALHSAGACSSHALLYPASLSPTLRASFPVQLQFQRPVPPEHRWYTSPPHREQRPGKHRAIDARETIWNLSNGVSLARMLSAPLLAWWVISEQWHLCLPGLALAGAELLIPSRDVRVSGLPAEWLRACMYLGCRLNDVG